MTASGEPADTTCAAEAARGQPNLDHRRHSWGGFCEKVPRVSFEIFAVPVSIEIPEEG
jgi:hypothetical protein